VRVSKVLRWLLILLQNASVQCVRSHPLLALRPAEDAMARPPTDGTTAEGQSCGVEPGCQWCLVAVYIRHLLVADGPSRIKLVNPG